MFSDHDHLLCEYLLLRCRRQDTAAAIELTAMFQQPLLYYLRRIVGTEADAWDVLQETWMAVFRSLHTLKERRAFPAYVYRVARNAALAHLRKRSAEAATLEEAVESAELPGEEQEEDFSSEDAERVHWGLAKLPLAQREVLTLHFLADLSLEEIGEVVGIPVGTVKSRLFHAKRGLRAVLVREEGAYER